MIPGAMTMPADFKYRSTALRGMPRHNRFDDFSVKHPPMSPARWAKIFAPFDALKGFDEAIAAKEVIYTKKPEMSEEDAVLLNRQLANLHNLTWNRRMARANNVQAQVTYYVPCGDSEHFEFGSGGSVKTVSGMVWYVDAEVTGTMKIGTEVLSIADILSVKTENRDLSRAEWEYGA